MFPGRSSDSQAQPTCRTSQATSPVSFWLSYLLTAAGQFRSLTGFPFHPLCRGTEEFDHYILSSYGLQFYPLRPLCRFGPKNGIPLRGPLRPSGGWPEDFAAWRPGASVYRLARRRQQPGVRTSDEGLPIGQTAASWTHHDGRIMMDASPGRHHRGGIIGEATGKDSSKRPSTPLLQHKFDAKRCLPPLQTTGFEVDPLSASRRPRFRGPGLRCFSGRR